MPAKVAELKRGAEWIFWKNNHVYSRLPQSLENYIGYRTRAEVQNAQLVMEKAFRWVNRKNRLSRKEAELIGILGNKVSEYPERNQPMENIQFTDKDIVLANEIGKNKIEKVLEKIFEIDLMASKHINIRGVNPHSSNNFAEHFFWQGENHAQRLVRALLSKI